MVCRSDGLSVCHDRELCQNSRTDRDAVWDVDLGGSKEACIRLSRDPQCDWAILEGERGGPYIGLSAADRAKRLNL